VFDTTVLSHAYRRETPREVEARFIFMGDRFVYNPPPFNGRALPSLTWSTAPDGISYLRAQVSLPKMLFGNNIEEISEADIPRSLDAISAFASDRAGVDYDAETANVVRLDVCRNWRRTEAEVYARLRALSNATIPRMTRRVIDDGTVEFKNSSQKVIAYAKLAETEHAARRGKAIDDEVRAAVGVIRLERAYLNSGACRRQAARLGLPDRRAVDFFRASVAETILDETMKELGLDKAIESADSRLSLLAQAYGYGARFQRLAGFLALCDAFGAENLVRLGIVKKSSFYDQRKEVEAANASIVSPGRRALPSLRLVRGTTSQETASVGNG
jgi:hypothetical protein